MSKKTDIPLIETDAEDASRTLFAAYKAKGKAPPMLHPTHRRKAANGAVTGAVVLSRLVKARKGRYTGLDDAAIIKAELGVGPKQRDGYAVICFTHKEVCFTQTRGAAMHGAVHTSMQCKRSKKAIGNSGGTKNTDGTVRVPIGWCSGCVASMTSASV